MNLRWVICKQHIKTTLYSPWLYGTPYTFNYPVLEREILEFQMNQPIYLSLPLLKSYLLTKHNG